MKIALSGYGSKAEVSNSSTSMASWHRIGNEIQAGHFIHDGVTAIVGRLKVNRFAETSAM